MLHGKKDECDPDPNEDQKNRDGQYPGVIE
jgi:hypothetical protein